jgi:site-specific DNA recombinase
VAPRVSPTETIRAEIDDLFSSGGDLLSVLEQVARLSVRLTFQSVIEEIVCDELGRGRYERRDGTSQGYRNGWQPPRTLKTTLGPVEVQRPKLRHAHSALCDQLFGEGVTKTNALETLVISCWVRGLSDRDIEAMLAEVLGEEAKVSKATASRICQRLRAEPDAWKRRDLSQVKTGYLYLDGSFFKMHPRAKAEPVLAAWGTGTDGAAEGDELVAEFIDDGLSGARLDRAGLDALRDAAEQGEIGAVWCLSPDRLARSFAYQMLVLDELARFGVAVYFTDSPPIDNDPEARLLVQVQGVIAEYEKAKFAERERRGKLYRARAGEVLSRKVPYGYRRVPRGPEGPAHLVVHEEEAAIVRRVFADFLGGTSVRRIAVALATEGTASPDGKPVWPLATIWRLLRNEAYVGRLYWNRTHTGYDPSVGRARLTRRPREEWVLIPVPAIVSDETFEAAQQAARDNAIFSPRRTEPGTFLLRRLVRCGHCGVKLAAHRARREYGMARYYLCPHHDWVRARGEDRRCPERRVRADELDAFVFDQVRQLLSRPELLRAGEAALASTSPVLDDELLAAQLSRLGRRRETAEAERRCLADLYQAGVIERAEMSRRAAELEARSRRYDQEREALVAQRAELAQANNLQRRITGFAERALAGLDNLDFNGRQQLLRLVLEDVRVQGWQVELRLRLPLDEDGAPAPQPLAARRTGRRSRSPRGPKQAKEGVSSNDRLRSTGERLLDVP